MRTTVASYELPRTALNGININTKQYWKQASAAVIQKEGVRERGQEERSTGGIERPKAERRTEKTERKRGSRTESKHTVL